MTTPPAEKSAQDVPVQIFEKFLQELISAGASEELIVRFRDTLLENKVYSEGALKAAIFGEESVS